MFPPPPSAQTGDCPADEKATRVQLMFDNIPANKGSVTIAVYGDKPSEFLEKEKRSPKAAFPPRPAPSAPA
jgi:hypothetical protein